jgi:hypothetical protein
MQIIVRGSVGDIMHTQKVPFEVAVLNCRYLVLVDCSASMGWLVNDEQSRYDAAKQHLKKLQNTLTGQILLASFNGKFEICPNGIPLEPSGITDLTLAFKSIYEESLHELVEKLILISDGAPHDEKSALAWAEKIRATCPIEGVFIGDEGDRGYYFMQKISKGVSFAVKADALDTPLKLLTSSSH